MIGSDNVPPRLLAIGEMLGLLKMLSDPDGIKSIIAEIGARHEETVAAYAKLGTRQSEVAASAADIDARLAELERAAKAARTDAATAEANRKQWEADKIRERAALDVIAQQQAAQTAALSGREGKFKEASAKLARDMAAYAEAMKVLEGREATIQWKEKELASRQQELSASQAEHERRVAQLRSAMTG